MHLVLTSPRRLPCSFCLAVDHPQVLQIDVSSLAMKVSSADQHLDMLWVVKLLTYHVRVLE